MSDLRLTGYQELRFWKTMNSYEVFEGQTKLEDGGFSWGFKEVLRISDSEIY